MTATKTASPWDPRALAEVEANYLDERSAAWMYRRLAASDKSDRRAFWGHLADLEDLHAQAWEGILRAQGRAVPPSKPFTEHRITAAIADVLGPGAVLAALHKEEVDGISKYRRQAREWTAPEAQAAFERVLPDEVVHEVDLFARMRREKGEAGALRSAILGANDGLGSILALAAGVAGAADATQPVLIAGLAGLVGGAVSMAASNYVSVKAETEVVESQVRLERDALEVAPETKLRQLEETYVLRGAPREQAQEMVRRLSKDPEAFLRAILETEHGITHTDFEDPLRLSLYTGGAFALAGLVPLVPYLLLPVGPAVAASLALTAAALFGAGVVRALSTLKPFLRSGAEMVLVGLGSAAATYLLGLAVGGRID